MSVTTTLQCIDHHDIDCAGAVEYRLPLSGTSRSFARCETHYERRLDRQEELDRDFPDSTFAPSWFDPEAAGERWDDDY